MLRCQYVPIWPRRQSGVESNGSSCRQDMHPTQSGKLAISVEAVIVKNPRSVQVFLVLLMNSGARLVAHRVHSLGFGLQLPAATRKVFLDMRGATCECRQFSRISEIGAVLALASISCLKCLPNSRTATDFHYCVWPLWASLLDRSADNIDTLPFILLRSYPWKRLLMGAVNQGNIYVADVEDSQIVFKFP